MILQAVALIIVVSALYWVYQTNRIKELPKVDSIVDQIDASVKQGTFVSNPIDFDAYWQINKDVYAYIYLADSEIDYPILQHPNDDSYYLNYTIDHVKMYPASIYTERINSKDFTDKNTMIYGHNMNVDNTMFNAITRYADATFFESHKYFYIYTPTQILQYEVFAAYENDDTHIMYQYDFTNMESYQQFLNDILQKQGVLYDTKVSLTTEDTVVTLSTCSEIENNRFIVHAKLINTIACEYKHGKYIDKKENSYGNMKK